MSTNDVVSCKFCSTSTGDKFIQCERCEGWSCITCSKLNDAEYDALSGENLLIHWYCVDCNQAALTAVKTDNLIEEKCKHYMFQIQDELETKMTNEFTKVREELNSLRHEQEQYIDKKVDERMNEMQNREERKNNLVLFNIPESEHADGADRKQDDRQFIDNVLAYLNATDCTYVNVFRLGKKGTSPRPLKVTSVTNRSKILKASKELRNSPSYKEVYVNKDMTPSHFRISQLLPVGSFKSPYKI